MRDAGACAVCMQVEKVADADHDSPVCQVLWNDIGNWLGVATENGEVSLWRPNLGGDWNLQAKTACIEQDSDFVMVD